MFDAMPPGQLATSTSPIFRSGSSLRTVAISQPPRGIIVYCKQNPNATQPGIRPTARKSSGARLKPIPSIDTASDQKIHRWSNQSIVRGSTNATTDSPSSQMT
jgi:hypothetical protein